MNLTLTSLQIADKDTIENAFTSAERHLFITSSKEGVLRVYKNSAVPTGLELELLKEYHSHQAPIMGLAFAPLSHKNYLLSAAYDRSLHLHNLEDPKNTEPLFSYQEEDKEVGFFTTCAFVPTQKDKLVFLVGTSTGNLLIFDSEMQFQPRKVLTRPNLIKSISANKKGQTLLAFSGSNACLFFDSEFSLSIEIGDENLNTQKSSLALFAPLSMAETKEVVVTAGEDGKVVLWTLDPLTHSLALLKKFEFEGPVAAAFWNYSSLSFNLIIAKKGENANNFDVFRVEKSAEKEDEWVMTSVNLIR